MAKRPLRAIAVGSAAGLGLLLGYILSEDSPEHLSYGPAITSSPSQPPHSALETRLGPQQENNAAPSSSGSVTSAEICEPQNPDALQNPPINNRYGANYPTEPLRPVPRTPRSFVYEPFEMRAYHRDLDHFPQTEQSRILDTVVTELNIRLQEIRRASCFPSEYDNPQDPYLALDHFEQNMYELLEAIGNSSDRKILLASRLWQGLADASYPEFFEGSQLLSTPEHMSIALVSFGQRLLDYIIGIDVTSVEPRVLNSTLFALEAWSIGDISLQSPSQRQLRWDYCDGLRELLHIND